MSDFEYEEYYYNHYNQIEMEEEFENLCNDLEYDLDELKEIAEMYGEEFLQNCSIIDLLDFLQNGDKLKVKKEKDGNDIFIPYPEDYENEEDLDNQENEWDINEEGPKWVIVKSDKELEEDRKKQQLWEEKNRERLEQERLKKEKELEEKTLKIKAMKNKYNWTLPEDLRGINDTKKQKPKVSKSKRRKERKRGGFKVNKSLSMNMKQGEQPQQQNIKRGFRVNKMNPERM